MRWQEECTLTTYEMQWTVRFYCFKKNAWADALKHMADGGNDSASAQAYCKRKQWTWHHLSIKSDRTFSILNNAYKSPL